MAKFKLPKIEKFIEHSSNQYETINLTGDYPEVIYPLYTVEDLRDEKKMYNFINSIKMIIRNSLEYKDYIENLRLFEDMKNCAFFNNITNFNSFTNKFNSKVKIEIHHEPFCLHDITHTIIRYFIDEEMPLNPLYIAEEVMRLHYENVIGLIPLCSTLHKLTHNGRLFIPIDSVKGSHWEFFEKYRGYMTTEIIEKYIYKKERTKTYNHRENTMILETKFVYYNLNGFDFPYIEDYETDFNEFIERSKTGKLNVSF